MGWLKNRWVQEPMRPTDDHVSAMISLMAIEAAQKQHQAEQKRMRADDGEYDTMFYMTDKRCK